jgi:prepilin-type N-terminal cleavage/methylation domain-containing protein
MKNSFCLNRKKYLGYSAFTLIEVLVASSIMAVLVTIVLSITTRVLDTWSLSSAILTKSSDASIALNYLAQDLESALFRNDRNVWLIADKEKKTGTIWLRFFTHALDRDTGTADVNAVSYQLLYINPIKPSSNKNKIYGLYRTVKDGEITFNHFLGQLDQQRRSDFMKKTNFNAVSSSFLSGNVVGINITFGCKKSNGNVINTKKSYSHIQFPLKTATETIIAPEYADIFLTVVSREGAKLLTAIKEGHIDMALKEVLLKHTTTYTRHVQLQGNFL